MNSFLLSSNIDVQSTNEAFTAFVLSFGVAFMLVAVVFTIINFVTGFKIFQKAGIAGWKIFIPFYNSYLQYQLVFGVGWLFLLNFLPIVSYILPFVLEFKLAKVFNKGTGFEIASLFISPINRLIIAFGESKYVGPLQQQY